MPPPTYQCSLCGETYEFVPEAEDDAQAEWQRDFGYLPTSEQAIVCDDCYQQHFAFARKLEAGS